MINPYIAGAPVTETRMFFGREDVFEWIEHSLTGRYVDHILVIHGQRRVGKTSVLKQLRHRMPERYVPVFFDLQGRTRTTLDRFLWWLAREIVRVLKQDHSIVVPLPERVAFAEDLEYFDGQFLPNLQPQLGGHNLLLTFDEFDALEGAEVKEELARPLIDYLRRLMGRERLNFIFSIGSSGRKLENMRASYTEFFKAALYKKISFLDQEDVRNLITRPVEGLLEYDRSAVDLIYDVTAGHPYFTQLVCHELFSYCQRTDKPRVREADVQAVLDDVVERGTVNLKFVWDEASDLEKWALAGLAHIERKADARSLAGFLRRQRVRFSNKDLDLALLHLQEKDVLTDDHRFVIELMRIWLQENRPLERVREELTEVSPIASRYIEIGLEYRGSGLYDKAIESFQEALEVDPDNVQAQVNIAEAFLEQKAYQRAVAEFQRALEIDEEDVGARTGLCEAHLALGDQLLSRRKVRDAMRSYHEVLAINPEHTEARQRMADIHGRRAENALADGRYEEALSVLEEALHFTPEDGSLEARYAQVQEQRRAKMMGELLRRAEREEAAKNWDRAIAILEEALEMAPDDESLRGKLLSIKEQQRAARLEAILARADEAADAERSDDAVAALNEYLSLEPGDAAVQERLIEAQRRRRESQLSSLKAQARSLVRDEKWEEALAAWSEYLALEPADRETVQAEIRQVEEGREMAQAYSEAQAAMARKGHDRAISHLKQIIAKDEDYRDASFMLAQAIALRRGQRPRWREPRLLAALGAGAVIIVVLGFLLLQPTSPLRVALAPRLPTATSLPTPWPTATPAPIAVPTRVATSMPARAPIPTPVPAPIPIPTSTSTPIPTPAPIPLSWSRLSSGQIFSRDQITAIVVDPSDPDVLYVGTANAGVYKSLDGGTSWQPAHNGLDRAGIYSLIIDHRDRRTLYAGVMPGGVYRTTDGGQSWLAVNKGIEPTELGLHSIVVMDPQDNGHLYYTSGPTIYESKNGGGSWSPVRESACPNDIWDLLVHPADPKTLFATDEGHTCEGGIYRSKDSGKTWTLTELRVEGPARLLEFGDGKLYASVFGELFGSVDEGDGWWRLSEGRWFTALAVHPLEGVLCGTSDGVLMNTRDGGETWQTLEGLDVKGAQIRAISISPHDPKTIFVGGQGLYVSTDNGATWAERSSGLGAARLELRLDPADTSTLYAVEVSEGGISRLYRSLDQGRRWEGLQKVFELGFSEGFGLALDADGKSMYRAEGDSILRSQDRGETWTSTKSPEGREVQSVAANPHRPGTIFFSHFPDRPPVIYLSIDGGDTWQSTSGINYIFDARLFFDYEQGQVVYAAGRGSVIRSEDGGKTWAECAHLEVPLPQSDSQLAIAKFDSDYLLLATRGRGVLHSQDGCLSWQDSSEGLDNQFVNTVAFNLKPPEMAYAGTDGGAYLSFKGGKTWGPVNDGLLGALVVYSIVVDPKDPTNVYAATPYGIFRLESP